MSTRPRLHLTPAAGWVNDPYGVRHVGGRYHVFFQHVPDSVSWGAQCHWGHATSTDLLHWEEQPVALSPAADELGAWSGCLVDDRILYTSVCEPDIERGRVRSARPRSSDWQTWEPGPVLVGAPPDPEVVYFRDPFVLREGDTWRMLVGAGLADGTGCALGYASDDLTTWTYDGVVASRHTSRTDPWTGAIWECPQLLRLPEADVLVLSAAAPDAPGDVVAGVGALVEGRFEVGSWHQLTVGAPYAATVFRDREGRPGLVSWLRGIAGEGWAGALGLPLVLGLDGERPFLAPHPAVERMRAPWDAGAPAWEVEWREGDQLRLGAGTGEVTLHRSADAVTLADDAVGLTIPLHGDGHATGVRLVRDGPVLEVFAGGRVAATPVSAGPLPPQGDDWQGWALR